MKLIFNILIVLILISCKSKHHSEIIKDSTNFYINEILKIQDYNSTVKIDLNDLKDENRLFKSLKLNLKKLKNRNIFWDSLYLGCNEPLFKNDTTWFDNYRYTFQSFGNRLTIYRVFPKKNKMYLIQKKNRNKWRER